MIEWLGSAGRVGQVTLREPPGQWTFVTQVT